MVLYDTSVKNIEFLHIFINSHHDLQGVGALKNFNLRFILQ